MRLVKSRAARYYFHTIYDRNGFNVNKGNEISKIYELKDVHFLNCYQDRTLISVEIYNAESPEDVVENSHLTTSGMMKLPFRKSRRGKFNV